jgi:hypothetical protein
MAIYVDRGEAAAAVIDGSTELRNVSFVANCFGYLVCVEVVATRLPVGGSVCLYNDLGLTEACHRFLHQSTGDF